MNPNPLIVALIAATLAGGASCAETFSFWFKKDVKHVAGFKSVEGHPCGRVADVSVSKLPKIGVGPLIPERVIELDSKGTAIRQWPMPVDFVPVAIRGSKLQIAFGDRRFWVESGGKFSKAAIEEIPETKSKDCGLKKQFGDSAYSQCTVFTDMTSKKERTLAFEGVCS